MSFAHLYPLRKIEDHWTNPSNGLVFEVLECGHKQRVKSDIYGETHPVRRRCRRCFVDAEERKVVTASVEKKS